MSQLPILILVLPMLLAPVLLILRNVGIMHSLVTIVLFINFFLTIILFQHVSSVENILYEVGNWPAPFGIRLNADILSVFFLIIINFMSLLCIASGKNLIEEQVNKSTSNLFYVAWLLCTTGFSGIILTDDIFNLFVFLEISSLSSYFLVSQGNYKGSTIAALQYLFIGSIAAVFILLSIGIIYMQTGTLNMQDISMKISLVDYNNSVMLALGLFLIGIGIKSAMFPLHGWIIKTYAYSPSVVTTFFSGTSTKIGIYILIRIFFDVFNNITPLQNYHLSELIIYLSLFGILVSTAYAIKQQEIKKMLALSSIAQLGYILLVAMLLIPEGITASLVHVINHSVIKTGLFLAIAIIFLNNQNIKLDDLCGLGKKYPLVMGNFIILSLGLIGIPLTAGFISKWYIVLAMLKSEYWYFTIVVLITSFMTFFYIWKMIENIYFKSTDNNESVAIKNYQIACITILTTLTIYFGIDTSLTADVAESIAYDVYYGAL